MKSIIRKITTVVSQCQSVDVILALYTVVVRRAGLAHVLCMIGQLVRKVLRTSSGTVEIFALGDDRKHVRSDVITKKLSKIGADNAESGSLHRDLMRVLPCMGLVSLA